MFYKKSKDEKLNVDLFKNPTKEYRGAPFWAWNTKLEKDILLEQAILDYEQNVLSKRI